MTNTVSTMTGLFKEIYADGFEHLVPETDILARDIPFVGEEYREGNAYHQPVVVSREHGWTLANDGSAFALNDPISAVSKDAVVQGAEFVLRSAISYGAMQKALKGKGESQKRAFVHAVSWVVENMVSTASYVREVQLLYGHASGNPTAVDGLGQISAVSGTGTTRTWTISVPTFASGIWAGAEGMKIDAYATDSTKRNANADIIVTAVDFDARTVSVSGNATDLTAVVANDILFFKGAFAKGFRGLVSMANATGTLFGINTGTYALWRGSTSSAENGTLSFAKVMAGLNRPAALGMRGDMVLYVSPAAWADMNNDLAALRRYSDRAGGKVSQGAEDIQYYGYTGSVTIKPHIYMKQGYALALRPKEVKRLGATDTTFTMPDSNGEIVFPLPNNAGSELRCYWNQAVLHAAPAHMVLFTNIVNSTNAV